MNTNLVEKDLVATDGSLITKLVFSAGWGKKNQDATKVFGVNVGGNKLVDVDIDVCGFLFNTNRDLLDQVWYDKLRTDCSSLIHTGDAMIGAGDGMTDNERIQIRLDTLPKNVKHIILVVNAFSGQNIQGVQNFFCRVSDRQKNDLFFQRLSVTSEQSTGFLLAKIYRHVNIWRLKPLLEECQCRTIKELIPLMAEHAY